MFIDTHNELENRPAVDPTGESNTSNGITAEDCSACPTDMEPKRADEGPGNNAFADAATCFEDTHTTVFMESVTSYGCALLRTPKGAYHETIA